MAELRRVEEVLGDTRRQLRAAEVEEEALHAKLGHLRQEADIAQAACDRARAAETAAVQARPASLSRHTMTCRRCSGACCSVRLL